MLADTNVQKGGDTWAVIYTGLLCKVHPKN